MITVIILYTVIGVFRTREREFVENNPSSGDLAISGDVEQISGDSEFEISYQIFSGENEVVLKGISEGSVSTTTYEFENEKLVNIVLQEEILSGDNELVESIYNYMKNNTEMSSVYSSIDRNGNVIIAVLREEYIESYGDAGKKEIYDELMSSLKLIE